MAAALYALCVSFQLGSDIFAFSKLRLPDEMEPLLSGENLTCIRGDRLVFYGLDFSVEAGGMLLLTGRNGSGKTSLLRLMAGIVRPSEGALLYCGNDCREDPEAHRADIHYVAHYDASKPALTVRENFAFWVELYGGGDVDAGLDAFGLTALSELPAQFLSAGQTRRLALARLAAIDAGLWLLDEPTVGLDSASLQSLRTLIASHRAGGGAVIASTHSDLHFADAVTLDVSAFAPERPLAP